MKPIFDLLRAISRLASSLSSSMTVGSRLDALLAHVDQHTLRTLAIGAVPLAALWLYLRLVHTPAVERAVRFAWTAPPEIRCVYSHSLSIRPS